MSGRSSTHAPPTLARRTAAVLAYPLVLGVEVLAAWLLLDAGHPASVVVPALNLAAACFVFGLERLIPYRAEWLRSHGDVPTDVAYFVASAVFFEVGRGLVVLASGALARPLVWPTVWPLAAQLPLALAVAELGVYWAHRLEHEVELLWRIHVQHHTPERLYWLNAARQHPLDGMATAMLLVGPLLLLGADERLVSLLLVFQGAHSYFQHSNAAVRLGPLNALMSMAEVHRWHHSRVLEESNANYGQTILLWDWVFGTRRTFPGEPPVVTGITGPARFPAGFLGQTVAPFVWRRVTSGP